MSAYRSCTFSLGFTIIAWVMVFTLGACSPLSSLELTSSSDISQPTPQATSTRLINLSDEGNATDINDDQFLVIEQIIIGLLLVAVLVGIAARQLRVPYTIGLVLIGLVLTLGVRINLQIPPNLILALLVPPLVFEAAFHINLDDLRQNLGFILTLAVPGVILTTLIVAGVVTWGTGLSLPVTLIFGALVSATDPVSVIALFRTMGAPKRLQVLLEGESLFNDGTAIVIFNLVLLLAMQGFEKFNPITSVIDFLIVAGGGLVVGLILGTLISQLISRIDDYLIETTLTTLLAFGAYLIAEVLGVSGVLAVVAAGLVNGNIGPRGMSPTTRIVVFNFWEYAGFIANSFIFLLIGLQIKLGVLFDNWQLIAWGILAVLFARAAGIYLLSRLGGDIPLSWQHVLYWGGLRGAISLALALSLPSAFGEAGDQVRVMAFGVVLFSLVVQGLSMTPLVRKLGIVQRSETQDEYERRHARAMASRIAYEHLTKRYRQGLLSDHTWNIIAPILTEHNKSLAVAVKEAISIAPDLEAEEMDTAHREYLRSQRSTINDLLRDRIISEDNYEQLATEIDTALSSAKTSWSELFGQASELRIAVNRLMATVVQEQDVESAISALTKIGVTITCLPSVGSFSRKHNTTLLIGFEHGQEAALVAALQQSCRKRVEYLPYPVLLTDALPVTPTPVEIGGATIFTFEVDRFVIF
jgi:CPA1 family monovalent cation:H+ antiporter